MKHSEYTKCYNEGQAAAKEPDSTEFDNPYDDGSEQHKAWMAGYEFQRGLGDLLGTV